MKTELKVGIFAIIGIIILTYMTLKVSGIGIRWEKGYKIHVLFDNISGLDEKSKVKVAGVDAGIVYRVSLDKGRAMLTLLMKPDVRIYEDASASLRMSGLLGDKYLSLWAGSPGKRVLRNGDWIQNTESAADIDALANKLSSAASYISDLAEWLKDLIGEKEKTSIKDTIHNLRAISENLNVILKEDRAPLHNTLVELEGFSSKLNEKGPSLIDELGTTARELRDVIGENRGALNEGLRNFSEASKSVNDVAQQIERGEGTLGKLLREDKIYDSIGKIADSAGKSFDVVDRLKTVMEFQSDYLTDRGDWKGSFNLSLQTREDLYYIFGVVSDPLGSTKVTHREINGVSTREEKTEREIEFSAQVAKRFEDFAIRIGMLENTFGFGADYFFNYGKGRVRMDVWDFSADEAGADSAHVKIGLEYNVFKNLFISSGIDNILNSDSRGIYIGGGLRFEDEDLKYLLSLSPM